MWLSKPMICERAVPAVASSPIPAVLSRLACADLDQVADLRNYLALVPDPRKRRGVRHSLGSVLALAAAAVAAGAQSFTAIGEWAADTPQRVLARLGARFDPRRDRHIPPDETTIRRVLCDIDGDDLDAAVSGWITTITNTPAAIAVDGKSLRGTFARTGGAGAHLLSALTHQDGTVLAQQQVNTGTSEITWMQPLLDGIDLARVVVTADALHTTRALARYLTRRDADYVLTVKANQHRLHTRLTALPWPQATHHTSTGIGHGRLEQRTIEVLPAPDDLGFPATAQFSSSPATAPAAPPEPAKPTPATASPACPPAPARPPSPPTYADTGKSRTGCTGSATPPTTKTTPASAPAPDPEPWPPSATSPSAPCTPPATPASPEHCDTWPETPHDHPHSSESPHDQHQRLCRNPALGGWGDRQSRVRRVRVWPWLGLRGSAGATS